MTNYQTCHSHYGYLEREVAAARELLERHGKPTPQTVKELRHETDMPMAECARMLRCMWRDMELDRLKTENVELCKLVEDMLGCIEIQIAFDRTPKKWMYEQFADRARKLRVEVD